MNLLIALTDRDLQARLDTLTRSRSCLLCASQGDKDRNVIRFDVDEGITCDESIHVLFMERRFRANMRRGVVIHAPAEILSYIGYVAENEFGKVAL